MNSRGFFYFLLCACLLVTLSGCGNKGPLVLEEDSEEEEEERRQAREY